MGRRARARGRDNPMAFPAEQGSNQVCRSGGLCGLMCLLALTWAALVCGACRSGFASEDSEAWDAAIASIADSEICPSYKGLIISPQTGLVPVGRDPESGLWEFAQRHTGDVPRRNRDGKLIVTERTALMLVLIPGGSFVMGAQREDHGKPNYDPHADVYPDASESDGPPHQVTLAPFFLSKYEMTQGQWALVTGENPSYFGPEAKFGGKQHSLLHPVEQVSWVECERVLRHLRLALPTEAQWEYAARGGTSTVWWTGDEKESVAGAGNLADRFCEENSCPGHALGHEVWLDDGYTAHAPVGSYRANPFGLHDTIGNVWEWCRDRAGSYELPTAENDGERHVESASDRMLRGGSFGYPASRARSANRHSTEPDDRWRWLGVRPARAIEIIIGAGSSSVTT